MRVVLSLLLAMTWSLRAATYQQSFQLPPIQLNASELRALLTTISEEIARTKPSSSEYRHPEYSIIITDDDTGATVAFDELVIPETHLPSLATTLHVSYTFYDAPISHIELNFYDFQRTLKVEGASYTDVTGCATLLQRELSGYTVPFGGPTLRIVLWEITTFAFAVLSIIFLKLESRYGYYFLALVPVMFAIAFAFPWKYILPGFVFHETEPSWVVRHSPQIAFVALLLTILIPALQLIFAKNTHRKRQRNKPAS